MGVIACVSKGLEHIHSKSWIHQDIKAANILLSQAGVAKIADFGCSMHVSATLNSRSGVRAKFKATGTPVYFSPELISSTLPHVGNDVWALGITIIEMMDGVPPLAGLHPGKVMRRIEEEDAPSFKCKKYRSVNLRLPN